MASEARVVIPYTPRHIFIPFHNRTQRWSVEVDHRRCGKTVSRVNDLIKRALICPKEKPRYAYIAPLLKQAKGVAWDYLKTFSSPLLEYGAGFNESELRVDYPNGAQIRLYGADNPDALRGIYLDGVVLDEYGDMDPRIWPVVRPALSDRLGWADFIGTPKGKNAFWEVWRDAQGNPEWYAAMHKAGITKLISEIELADARKTLTKDQYAQEYECSFEAAIRGAYFGTEMADADNEKRVANVPYDKATDVITAWDIGIGDSTAIWFCQRVGQEIHLIDYIENNGVGADWYVKQIKDRPYIYAGHLLPHDAESKEKGSGKSYTEVLAELNIDATIVPRLSVDAGINAVRLVLNRCWFDADKCSRGIEALKQYRTEWDDKTKVFRDKPAHDWTSHAADAFRYLITGMDKIGHAVSGWSDEILNWKVDWVA